MHDKSGFDFTKFVPGFDFLKNMNAGSGAATSAANPAWVAPTLDPAELDKRIQELKTVHFWLDQNTKAVSATIQALEVQRMTLSALQNMNVSFGEMADALKIKPHAAKSTPAHGDAGAHDHAKESHASSKPKSTRKPSKKAKAAGAGVDPSQWWGALTQQFQNIANTAMHEMAKNADSHPGAPASAAHSKAAHSAATKASTKAGAKTATKTATQPVATKRSFTTRSSKTTRTRSRG